MAKIGHIFAFQVKLCFYCCNDPPSLADHHPGGLAVSDGEAIRFKGCHYHPNASPNTMAVDKHDGTPSPEIIGAIAPTATRVADAAAPAQLGVAEGVAGT